MGARRSLEFDRARLELGAAIIAGWTGRDPVALEHHIRELEEEGIPRPKETPMFYRVGVEVLTQAAAIQVAGGFSSGEVEAFIARGADGWWVGAGSDHTDRRLEGYSVTLSKQACPKPLAAALWPFDEVKDHWGELVARSWIVRNGSRELYQEGTLGRNRHPSELVALYEQRGGRFEPGGFMLCGTQPAIGGIRYAERFEFELVDPVRGRRIAHGYDIVVLPADLPES